MNSALPYLIGLIAVISSFFGAFSSGGSSLILLGALFLILDAPYLSLLTISKTAAAVMVFIAAFVHQRKIQVNLKMIGIMTVTGLVGMGFSTYLLQYHLNQDWFENIMAGMLLILGTYFLFAKTRGTHKEHRITFSKKDYMEVAGIFLILSFLNGFAGGMGFIFNAFLVLRLKMNFIEATAYTIISGIVVNGLQAAYLIGISNIPAVFLLFVSLGAVVGGYLGTQLQYIKGSATVKWSVSVMMLILGFATLLR